MSAWLKGSRRWMAACFALVIFLGSIAMSEAARIETSRGTIPVTVDQLVSLKADLIRFLTVNKPVERYQFLVDELNNWSKPMIFPGGVARIGVWKLIYKNGENYLERQQMPRSKIMIFYYARLKLSGEKLTVVDVKETIVRGR